MEPKVLADALVEAGICDKLTMQEPHSGTAYQFPTGEPDNGWLFLTEESLITDWRVAGKVLELCGSSHLYWDDVDFGCDLTVGIGKSEGFGTVDGYARLGLPRAIIEAWYQATEQEDTK